MRATRLADALRAAVVIFAVLAVNTSASAQTPSASAQTQDAGNQLIPGRAIPVAERATQPPGLPMWDTAARQEELDKWIEEFSDWQEWAATWGNRREPGWFTSARNRRPRPDPPLWLFDACKSVVVEPDATNDPCQLLAQWSAGAAGATQPPVARSASAGAENNDKTTWWEHVHLDGGWPALQSGVNIFGALGMHATTTVKGRFQIFVAPGAMLMNVPTTDGGRAWTVATTYGIAYRLGEFTIPGTTRRAYLHLNLVKAWLLSSGPNMPSSSTDFGGLSVTFKKNP
jgi:hypothetical protein